MSPPEAVPEWVATVVGQLVLENAALRRALAQSQPPIQDTEPEREPVS